MDLALAEGCDLAELARQSKIQLGAATTSNPRPTVSEVGRSKLEFASEAGRRSTASWKPPKTPNHQSQPRPHPRQKKINAKHNHKKQTQSHQPK
jgi:hypothetical protein